MNKCVMGLSSMKKAWSFTHKQTGNIAEVLKKKKNIYTGGRGVRWNISVINDMLVALELTAVVTTCMRPL